MKTIIIDDDVNAADNLRILLKEYCGQTETSEICHTIESGVAAIRRHKPDVVFLDINLQSETGFDLFKHFTSVDFEVIFTTAHAEYAVKAFKFSAIDFLLKPIDIDELQAAVMKVEKKIEDNVNARLEQLFQDLNSKPSELSRLALPTLEGLTFVNVGDIIYLEADDNYTNIYLTGERKFVVSKNLRTYEELLAERNFFRIHHSYIVNTRFVQKYIRGEGGQVILTNQVTLDVSRRKKQAFLSKLGVAV